MWSRLNRVVVFLFLGVVPVFSQYYYEKNKIQREVDPIYTYETEHFSIYIEEGGEPLARFAAEVMEDAYAQHSSDFGFSLGVKVPVIIYKSQPDFAATNILLEPLEESAGGFSEIFKNRVVVPLTGSYQELHDVLYYEPTHILQYEMHFFLAISNLFSLIPGFTPPLWIMEGSAEFCSSHGGEEEDAFMRDLLLSNNVIPLQELEYWGGYIVYRQGESVFLYMEDRYGRDKVFELLHALKIRRDMDGAFEKVFGVNVEEFGKQWMNWLRMQYLPDVAKLDNRTIDARLLTDHLKDFSYYDGSVTLSPSGAKIAYITTKDDYITVNVISAFDGKPLKKILRAGRSATFERLPLLRRNLAWSADEAHLAAIGFSRQKPVLLWIDYASGDVARRYPLPVDDAYSPAVSPDGAKLVFVGIKQGMSDIYQLDLASGQVERLTYDLYEERDLSCDDDKILFVSDRPDGNDVWNVGSYAVWELLQSGRTNRLTPHYTTLRYPYRVDNELVFIGPDFQPYSWDADSTLTQLTDWFESVEELSLASSGKAAMLIYNNAGWDVGVLNGTIASLEEKVVDEVNLESHTSYSYEIEEITLEDMTRYRPAFSADYLYGSGAYSSLYGATGSFALGISDMLGDHRFYINAELYGDILYSDVMLTYWYLKRRIDFAVGGFQLADFYMYYPDTSTYFTYIRRARRGVSTLVSTPISKFFRIETGVDGMAVTEEQYYNCSIDNQGYIIYTDSSKATYPLFQANGAVVFDNALWKYATPMRGLRLRLGGYSSILSPLEYQTAYADLRGYLGVTRRASFALRTFAGAGFGADNEYFTLGGAYDVRGYSTYYPDFGSRLAFANLELRVPFIDRLDMSFPLSLSINGIRGAVFTDAGVIWDRGEEGENWPTLWDSSGLVDLKASFGGGIRFLLGYWMLKLDFARPYQKEDPSLSGWDVWRVHFRVGADF